MKLFIESKPYSLADIIAKLAHMINISLLEIILIYILNIYLYKLP